MLNSQVVMNGNQELWHGDLAAEVSETFNKPGAESTDTVLPITKISLCNWACTDILRLSACKKLVYSNIPLYRMTFEARGRPKKLAKICSRWVS